MIRFANKIDCFSNKVGQFASFLILPMVLLTFTLVLLRYGFGIGKVWLQELIIYIHGTFFILGISYGVLKNNHVRVDVFYSRFTDRNRVLIDILGTIFFLWPFVGLIFFKSIPYVYYSLNVLESSPDPGGLPGRFIIKSLIPVFCILVFIQSISSLVHGFNNFKKG